MRGSLRSDFATTGTFPVAWHNAAYQAGGTATIVADTDRSGCNGVTVASGVQVQAGTNTTVWNTVGVAAGRYWLCLTIANGLGVTSGYAGGVLVVGANPPVVDPSPTAAVDEGTLSGRTYTVSGWAFDPNAPQQPIHVDVYDRRPDGSQAGVRLSTGESRPDVARIYPGTGQNAGFYGSLQLTGGGRHSVCAHSINVGAGANRLIRCLTVELPVPKGSLETAAPMAPGALRVSGWASDPEAPTAAEEVDVYVTGPEGRTFTVAHTGGARPDVTAAFPWAGPNSGFSATVPTAGLGANQVRACVITVHPPGPNILIGCRAVTVANAFGHLDVVRVVGGQIVAGGWALNPNNPTGPVQVHVYDQGPSGTNGPTAFTADQPRPDVALVYRAYGPNHGFSAAIPAVGTGPHNVCVYAITTGGGTGNTLVGCAHVTVPSGRTGGAVGDDSIGHQSSG